ncbi:MAG: Cupin 2 conserved barrel domain protein [Rhizobacter sp.]|nr:Cupin 2 conserved barrel domain protein [Rhizobacter sp.]
MATPERALARRNGPAAQRAPADEGDMNIGERIKELRLAKGLTISRLATLAGVPGSTISKIENGQLRPSLVHAINLANALEENLAFIAGRYRDRPQPRSVVRASDRQTINYPDLAFALQDLSGQFLPGVLEARLGMLEPGAHSGVDPMTHQGEEICYVVEGAIRYRIANGFDVETIELLPREYLQFKSGVPHSWENSHSGQTKVLWVFSDGLSF